MDAFLGMIMPVGFNYAPAGWSVCNGNLLPIQQYNALFAIMGTNYGGNGTSNFGLPNLQGRFVVGVGQQAGGTNFVQGAFGGSENFTPRGTSGGLLTANNIPALTASNITPTATATTVVNGINGATTRVLNPGGNLACNAYYNAGTNPVTSYASPTGSGGTVTPMAPNAGTTTVAITPFSVSVGNATPTAVSLPLAGLQATSLPPYQSALYVIALVGLFPSRN